jgi:hypothetical protein
VLQLSFSVSARSSVWAPAHFRSAESATPNWALCRAALTSDMIVARQHRLRDGRWIDADRRGGGERQGRRANGEAAPDERSWMLDWRSPSTGSRRPPARRLRRRRRPLGPLAEPE